MSRREDDPLDGDQSDNMRRAKRLSPAARGIRQRLSRFEAAVRAHEMKGSEHPDLWAAIEDEYRVSRNLLLTTIERNLKQGT